MVFDYLKDQGLCPQLKEEVIVFKYQMCTFIYFVDDDDEKFFRLALPGIYDVTEWRRHSSLMMMSGFRRRR